MGKASQNAECKFSEFYQYVVKLPFVYLSVCLSGYLFIRLFYSYYHYHAFGEINKYIWVIDCTSKERLPFNREANGLDIQTRFYCSCDLDLAPMTFIYELDLRILRMSLHTKNELSSLRLSKVKALQTNTQIDRCDRK